MNERTALRRQRCREIAEEILIDPELATYTAQVAEIGARYDVGNRQAKNLHSEAQAFLPEAVARRANEIRARAVARADVALTRAMDVAEDASELSKIASASASLATTLEKIEPTQWLTPQQARTQILTALLSEDFDDEQVGLIEALAERVSQHIDRSERRGRRRRRDDDEPA